MLGKNKKVAVITLHTVKNYGSVLQTYATQCILKNLGMDVEIINYIRASTRARNSTKNYTKNDAGVVKFVKGFVLLPTILRWEWIFGNYLKKNICISSNTYYCEQDLIDHPIEADIFCTGSDQVWNSGWNEGIEKVFYLSFVPDYKKRVALSASFGKIELNEEEKNEIAPMLKKYSFITVREKSALDVLLRMGITNTALCLDPTLLLSREEWIKHIPEIKKQKKYILIYQLNRNKEFDRYAIELARKKNLKLVRLCTRFDQIRLPGHCILMPKVWEFVSLINEAEYVITDSFHATVFSINLNTDFISVYPNEYSCRINDILILLGLEDRRLQSYDNFNIIDKKIDFNAVNRRLENIRKESMTIIEKMFFN